jgi:hypothetical protein
MVSTYEDNPFFIYKIYNGDKLAHADKMRMG